MIEATVGRGGGQVDSGVGSLLLSDFASLLRREFDRRSCLNLILLFR